jgi:uncharacterized protein YqhQ
MPAPALPSACGQAVLEGILMRSAGSLAVAVRRPSGEIVVRERAWRPLVARRPLLALPILRGIASLLESCMAGLHGLSFAAEQAGMGGPLANARIDASVLGPQPARESSEAPPNWLSMALCLTVAICLGLSLFVALPHMMAVLLTRLFGHPLALQSLAFGALTGLCKLLVFFTYLACLGTLRDIRRLFMYHGAEHMVLATYAAGEPLDLLHARAHPIQYTRCGTSFLLVFVLLTIVVFSLLFGALPDLGPGWQGHLLALLVKVPALLPTAGLAYEINLWACNHSRNSLVRALLLPGFTLQRLTTRQPIDDMLEVALVALKAALNRNNTVPTPKPSTLVYRSFADGVARQADRPC